MQNLIDRGIELVSETDTLCPICNAKLIFFDRAKRIVRTKGRQTYWVQIDRMKCTQCGMIHRVLPDYILPYKQYEAEMIWGVIEGLITSDMLGYEDYPCEATMNSWRRNA